MCGGELAAEVREVMVEQVRAVARYERANDAFTEPELRTAALTLVKARAQRGETFSLQALRPTDSQLQENLIKGIRSALTVLAQRRNVGAPLIDAQDQVIGSARSRKHARDMITRDREIGDDTRAAA